MHSSIPLTLILAVACTGCTAFRKSLTWQKVIDSRGERTVAQESAYHDRLHQALASDNVEHKVVTYQYRYKTRMDEDAVGTGTAVIYRDSSNSRNPWWIMDEHLATPIWLPNEEVDQQVKFFLHRDAQVLAQQDYPAGDRSKEVTEQPALAAPPGAQGSSLIAWKRSSKAQSLAKSEKMIAHKAPGRSAAPRLVARAAAPVVEAGEPQVVTRSASQGSRPLITRVFPAVRPARFASDLPGSEPQPMASSMLERRVDLAFRAKHGTGFDPASTVDRGKMDSLRQALLQRNQSSDLRSF